MESSTLSRSSVQALGHRCSTAGVNMEIYLGSFSILRLKDEHCYTATSTMGEPVCDRERNVSWHGCKIELKMIACLTLFEFASCRHACFRFLHVGLAVVDRPSAWPHALILNIGARSTQPWTALPKVTSLWLWKISFYSSWHHPVKIPFTTCFPAQADVENFSDRETFIISVLPVFSSFR